MSGASLRTEPAIRLALRHDYYAHADDGEPFRVVPARDTVASLRDHGILVRTSREDVVVLRDTARRMHLQRPDAHADWIAFLVYGADAAFASVSDVDMPVGRARDCLYFTNLASGTLAVSGVALQAALLTERLPILARPMLVPVAPGQRVDVLSHGGDTMMALTAPGMSGERSPIRYDAAAGRAQIDLLGLPAGRYVVRVDAAPVTAGLVLNADAVPAAFLELVLPRTGDCADYTVAFKARSTYWKYTVVPRPGSGALDSLAIAPAANGSAPRDVPPAFLGPFEETLGNGASVHQFLSAAPIALASRSGVRLRLTGRRKERMTRESVLVEYLPVPAKHQLALLTDRDLERLGTEERLCSEVFVYV